MYEIPNFICVLDVQEFIVLNSNDDLKILNSQPHQSQYVMQTLTTSMDARGAEYKWSENSTRILIDFYKKSKNKLGTFEVKSIKIMWVKIAEELRKLNINVTANNCMNRWRVIERNYKKYVEDQNKTGIGAPKLRFVFILNYAFFCTMSLFDFPSV